MSGNLVICCENEKCGIILSGRVNFETVIPLRNFVNALPENINDLTVDLGECLSMDSTCMGVLSMMALTGIKRKLKMRILNAGGNRQLLKGLGVEKLFKFEDAEFVPYSNVIYPTEKTDDKNMKTAAETVLQAHQSLMDADDSNKARFGAVVEMTRQDLDRMKKD